MGRRRRAKREQEREPSAAKRVPADPAQDQEDGRALGLGAVDPERLSPDSVLRLQHEAGNAGVRSLLTDPGQATRDSAPRPEEATRAPAGPVAAVARQEAAVEAPPEEGNPVAPADPGTTHHPTVRLGSRGAAVEELQQKLNTAGADPRLSVDGIFGPITRRAVVAFQRAHGLSADGIVGRLTWTQLDAVAPGSTVGRVERTWSERVGGQTYGMTSRYTWRITDTEIRTTVRIRFVPTRRLRRQGVDPAPTIAFWLAAIQNIWNRFNVVNEESGESLAVTFVPLSVRSGADNRVNVHPGSDRADAENWYVDDPDGANTAAHEFGHMIGLEDEYQRDERDYRRLTGEEPPEGETAGTGADAIARELHDALHQEAEGDRVSQAQGVINTHNLRQGEFAQEVAESYRTQFGVGLVTDIVDRIPDEDEFPIVDPFTYATGSIMGEMTNHQHPVEPRHLREFVQAVQNARGGTWRAEER